MKMKTKVCEICGKEFEPVAYGGARKYCFECVPLTTDSAQRTLWKRQAAKREGVRRLGGCCKKCGESRYHVLDFHHIDPSTKNGTPSRFLANSQLSLFFNEIELCVLLCSNCHQDFHWNQAQNKELTLDFYLNNNIE